MFKGKGPSLFDRNWINIISLNWANINVVSRIALDEVLERHPQLFIEEHALLQWTTAKIYVDTDAKPRFYKPQTV